MTTRQYIGARYIPIFADPVQWDADRAYEYLTMVQSSGETYMSKQEVPIGVQLPDVSQGEEDNAYWVHMSNWNAQVEIYRQEVLQYNDRISAVENGLPITVFNSENTVDDAIDAIQDQIGSGFDDEHTIASAISTETSNRELAISTESSNRESQDFIRPITFENVAAMQASDNLENGMICKTLGFNLIDDGGSAWYKISNSGTANGMDVIGIPSNATPELYATLLTDGDKVNVKQLGASNSIDCGDILNHAVSNYQTVYVPNGTYPTSKPIKVGLAKTIIGESMYSAVITASDDFQPEAVVATDPARAFTLNSIIACFAPAWTGINGAVIQNLGVEGENASVMGIEFVNHATGTLVQNCRITNCTTGIKTVANCWGHSYIGNFFIGCSERSIWLAEGSSANGCFMGGNSLFGSTQTPTQHIFVGPDNYGVTVSGGFIEKCKTGLYLSNAQVFVSGLDVEWCETQFVQSVGKFNDGGVYLSDWQPVKIDGCTFVGSPTYGIYSMGAKITVEDCSFITQDSTASSTLFYETDVNPSGGISVIDCHYNGWSAHDTNANSRIQTNKLSQIDALFGYTTDIVLNDGGNYIKFVNDGSSQILNSPFAGSQYMLISTDSNGNCFQTAFKYDGGGSATLIKARTRIGSTWTNWY